LSGTQGSGASPGPAPKPEPEKTAAPEKGTEKPSEKGSGKAPKAVEAAKGPAEPEPAPELSPPLPPPAPPAKAAAEPVRRPVASFDPMADPARLRISTTPPGAEVTIDDRPAGQTPLAVENLDPGKVMIIKVALDGYQAEKRVAKGEDGRFPAFALTLTPLPKEPAAQPSAAPPAEPDAPVGYLITMTKPIAKVLVDGKETGRWTPVQPKNPINLPPGAHSVVFETAAGKRYEQRVTIEVGKTTKVIKLDL
jgi:hypothetical protein